MLFGQAKVHQVDSVLILTLTSHDEIRRLNIPMYQSGLMHVLNTREHLQQQMNRIDPLELPWMALLVRG